MTKLLGLYGVVSLGVLLSSPVPISSQQILPAFPRDGAIKVKDVERFRIWDVTLQRGKSTGTRKLDLDQVSVSLNDGALKVTLPDGTWRIEQERVGSVRFESKGSVLEEQGLSDMPVHEEVFQLKESVPLPWPVTANTPAQFPRVNTVKLFETDRINVWDERWIPGDRITRHLHYHRTAAVFLEEGTLRLIPDQGEAGAPFTRKPGEVIVTDSFNPSPHEEEQVAGSPRAIWIEFK
jgi:hypothetical protein